MNVENLCMGCMSDKGGDQICAACGYEEDTPPDPWQIRPRTILAGKYVIGRVLGQGGFGITYLAWDLLLDRKLAIKEHYPRQICTRGRSELTLQPLTKDLREEYKTGLMKFVEEGRALARFYDHPGIVLLLDFVEANGTAYLVMAYVAGMTFKKYLQDHGGRIGFAPALDILTPVMDALREVHRMGMLHRDVSPDNIYINEKKEVKILDFGSTRNTVSLFSHVPAVKPGYSPIEQYGQAGKQGTWTDVYATAATLYRAVTGKTPSDAPDRRKADPLVAPSKLGVTIPPALEKALLKALSVEPRDRFQTMEDFSNAVAPPATADKPHLVKPSNERGWLLASGVVACLLLVSTLAFATMWLHGRKGDRYIASEASSLREQLVTANSKLTEQQKKLDEELAQANTMQGQSGDLQGQVKSLQARVYVLDQQNKALNGNVKSAIIQQTAIVTERDLLKDRVKAAANDDQNQKAQINSLTTLTKNLLEQSLKSISVDKLGLYGWDGKDRRSGPATDFAGNSIRSLGGVMQGPNPLFGKQALSAALNLRYIAPDGITKASLVVGIQSGKDDQVWNASFRSTDEQQAVFKQRGNWRVEVAYQGHTIKEIPFKVY